VVHSGDEDNPSARQIIIPKVRLKRIAGNTGTVPLSFNETTGLFIKPDF
jgi:twinkle protein